MDAAWGKRVVIPAIERQHLRNCLPAKQVSGQSRKSAKRKSRDEMTAETPKGAWGMKTLLFFYMLVNFADKIVVGLAAVPIMKDLGLSPEQFGLLGSMF